MSESIDNRTKLGEVGREQHVQLAKNSAVREILTTVFGLLDQDMTMEQVMFVLGQEMNRAQSVEGSIMNRLRQKYSKDIRKDDEILVKDNGEVVIGEE